MMYLGIRVWRRDEWWPMTMTTTTMMTMRTTAVVATDIVNARGRTNAAVGRGWLVLKSSPAPPNPAPTYVDFFFFSASVLRGLPRCVCGGGGFSATTRNLNAKP